MRNVSLQQKTRVAVAVAEATLGGTQAMLKETPGVGNFRNGPAVPSGQEWATAGTDGERKMEQGLQQYREPKLPDTPLPPQWHALVAPAVVRARERLRG